LIRVVRCLIKCSTAYEKSAQRRLFHVLITFIIFITFHVYYTQSLCKRKSLFLATTSYTNYSLNHNLFNSAKSAAMQRKGAKVQLLRAMQQRCSLLKSYATYLASVLPAPKPLSPCPYHGCSSFYASMSSPPWLNTRSCT
jgi:hypothetical protein